jgi:hypothetical protein
MGDEVDHKVFTNMQNGNKSKFDSFQPLSNWYSDTLHVDRPYLTVGEPDHKGVRNVDQFTGSFPRYLEQPDVIMPLLSNKMDRSLGEDKMHFSQKGTISVNAKNLIGRQADPQYGYQDVSEGLMNAPIWGDILDDGKKTGTQVLLKPKYNIKPSGQGNYKDYIERTEGKYYSSKPQDIAYRTLLYGFMDKLHSASTFKIKEGSEIGWAPKKVHTRKTRDTKYVYRNADGTQYYSSKPPWKEE